MLGVYNYTVILTYLGMATGFIGIVLAMDGGIKGALICLLIAGMCDMFDGKIASTLERTPQEKRFGIQIDSLSDLVCFGMLPAVITYVSCGRGAGIRILSALYLLCTLIRLAWFNVDEEERQARENSERKAFLGLPVTTAALVFPGVIGMGHRQHWPVNWIEPVVMFLMSVAFLTPFRLKKPALPGKIGMVMLGGLGLLMVILSGMDV